LGLNLNNKQLRSRAIVCSAEQDLQVNIPCRWLVRHFTETDFSALHSRHLKEVSNFAFIFLSGFLLADFRFAIKII
jgi:hypothetical protein